MWTFGRCRRLILILFAQLYSLCFILGQISELWGKQWLAARLLVFLPDQFFRENVLCHRFLMATLIRIIICLLRLELVLAHTTCRKLGGLWLRLRTVLLKFRFAACILLATFLASLREVFACISSLLFHQIVGLWCLMLCGQLSRWFAAQTWWMVEIIFFDRGRVDEWFLTNYGWPPAVYLYKFVPDFFFHCFVVELDH